MMLEPSKSTRPTGRHPAPHEAAPDTLKSKVLATNRRIKQSNTMDKYLTRPTATSQHPVGSAPAAKPTPTLPKYTTLNSREPGPHHPPDKHEPAKLKIATLNVQSLSYHKTDVTEIMQGTYGDAPEILVLTETKVKHPNGRQYKKWLIRMRRRYIIHQSTVREAGHAKAGVLIAISKRLTEMGTITRHTIPDALSGYFLHLTRKLHRKLPLEPLAYCGHVLPA
jgi:hypothetical protein